MSDSPLPPLNRRRFLERTGLAAAAATVAGSAGWTAPAPARPHRMQACLVGGSIGVRADQHEAIRLARKHGFDAVEPQTGFIARLDDDGIAKLRDELAAAGLVWGQAGAPIRLNAPDDRFREGMELLPRAAAALRRAGVKRVGTWISPSSGELTYLANFRRHARRVRAAARILADHDLRLGLEYVGTHTLLIRGKYPFLHTLAELRDLLAEVGADNVGAVLDSWHWWQAGDTPEQVRALPAARIVSVDLNDAPQGVPFREQQDNHRELPLATGVIPVKGFLEALRETGFDGPVRAEPFNDPLNRLDNDAACAATIKALRQAFALIE